MQAAPEIIKAARKAHLRYISDSILGFERVKNGKAFKYLNQDGRVIGNDNIVKRIDDLVIPPAWKEVWISPYESGHLQATGIDEKGRKQYIYHPDWIKISQESKFDKMVDFGFLLPKIRSRVRKDMGSWGLVRKKVLATVTWLLEHTFIRIGNEEYSKENNSFGLTTLRSRHVNVLGSTIKFEFKGKSGIEHKVSISHPAVTKIIKKMYELPGFELFQCIDEDGSKHKIDSADVNEYLHEISGQEISAKDFRTWGGTVLSAESLHQIGSFDGEKMLKKNINQAVKVVSNHLRNTMAVCRNYYIHPTVIDTYSKEILIPHFEQTKSKGKKMAGLSLNEFGVLSLLQKYQ